ncbi:hypothetical protein [Vibrio ziniensis]|uniref:Uncharacterized protein n=1 Tax=Vibrio ziniensis TaxID=2711221 RepID=A0A6G7CPK0_9VIBR|nr:hypothetical protein [Vibrio ziniensis]QIH43983.1 hypothetical protein G5S32_18585 [Vibrio ziniensis]
MKYTAILTTAALLTLSGCQSTKSPEEEAMLSNLCMTGDSADQMISMETFNEAVMQCGGYEIFTEDMLSDKKFSFSFSDSGARELTFSSDGSVKYYKAKKGTTEALKWVITDKGNLVLTWDDGYKWEWVLMSEKSNVMAIKTFAWAADGSDKEIITLVAVSSAI